MNDYKLEDYQKIYEKNMNSQRACFDYGLSLFRNNQFLDAYGIFMQASALNGKYNKHSLLFAARSLKYLGKYDFAIDMFNSLINTSEAVEALEELAVIYKEQGDFVNNIKVFEKLYTLTGDQIRLCQIGSLYLKLNDVEKAKSYFNKVSRDNIAYQRVLFEYGCLEIAKEDYENALNYFNKIDVEKDTNMYYACLSNKGFSFFKLKNYDEAKKCFLKCINSDNVSKYSLFYLALMRSFENDYTGAIEYLTKLMEIDPTINIASKLSVAYIRNHEYRKAFNVLTDKRFSNEERYNCKLYYNIYLFLAKKLNIQVSQKNIPDVYSINQMVNYSKKEAISHVVMRHCNPNMKNVTCFNNTVDIANLFSCATSNMLEKYRYYDFMLNDIYFIPMSNIGVNDEKYLCVVALPESKNIITMYPVNDVEYNNEDELNVNDYEDEKKGFNL